jgi:MaoC like domain
VSAPQPELLPEVPSLSRLYLNAAGIAAKNRLLGGDRDPQLPAYSAEVRGVVADLPRLTAYQHLLGDTARDVMPAGFVHTVAFPVAMQVMVREDFPLPLLGMIHLRNRVQSFAPIHYSRPLTVRSWARDLTGHRAGTQVDLVMEVRADDAGDVLWRGVSTYLAKGVYLPGIDRPGPAPTAEGFDIPAPTALWRLGVDTGRQYAAVSGDFNPIHLSALSAKALGMRRSIAHGMFLASRALVEASTPEPDAFAWSVSFEAPVYLPTNVAVRIADDRDDDGAWTGSSYVGWNRSTGRRHFSGRLAPLSGNP